MPHLLLEETPERIVTCLLPGTIGKRWTLAGHPDWFRRLDEAWGLAEHVWHTRRVVITTTFGTGYSLEVHWDHESAEFLGWYVNLQEPLRRTPFGYDTMDQMLDIWIEPNRSWHWKDCEEFHELELAGLFTAAEGEVIRSEGRHVIDNLSMLLPIGWESWRPESSWPLPTLPDGWERL